MNSMHIFVVVLLFAVSLHAKKTLPQFEAATVGTTFEILIKPQLEAFSNIGLQEKDRPRSWQREIKKEGASFIKVHFKNFNLAPGDELIIKSKTGRVIERLRLKGPRSLRTFWGLSVFGDTAFLELKYRGEYEVPPFEIDKLVAGQTNPAEFTGFSLTSLSLDLPKPFSLCGEKAEFEPVKCHESNAPVWANVTASVGVMTVGGNVSGSVFCSGSNISPNNYILTNAHCIRSQQMCDASEFVFKYHNTSCNGGFATDEWVSFRCEKLEEISPFSKCDPDLENLDFSISKVAGNPAAEFGYVKIDREPLKSGEGIYIVQNPDGRPQEITFGDGDMVKLDGRTIRYYGTLDTEEGSSGAPIFRQSNNKLVGIHHCGGCEIKGVGNRGVRIDDIYPYIEKYTCTEGVSYSVSAGDLVEVIGNGNGVIDPGEVWESHPILKNTSCSDMTGEVTIEFEVNKNSLGRISLKNKRIHFHTVRPGESLRSPVGIRFKVEPTDECGETIQIGLNTPKLSEYQSFRIGRKEESTLASEDFSKKLPFGWSIMDGGTGEGEYATWTTSELSTRDTGLTEPYFIVDSDHFGEGGLMDESLITSEYDLTNYNSGVLQFSHAFKPHKDEKADVEIRSSKTSGEWVRLRRFTKQNASGTVSIDISTYAAGASGVQFRFRYFDANYDWYWAIDDVYVTATKGFSCEAFGGSYPL